MRKDHRCNTLYVIDINEITAFKERKSSCSTCQGEIASQTLHPFRLRSSADHLEDVIGQRRRNREPYKTIPSPHQTVLEQKLLLRCTRYDLFGICLKVQTTPNRLCSIGDRRDALSVDTQSKTIQ
jgi:hypothetical protein